MFGVKFCEFFDRLSVLLSHEVQHAHVECELLPTVFVVAKKSHSLFHYHVAAVETEDLHVFDVLLHAELILGVFGFFSVIFYSFLTQNVKLGRS